MLICLTWLSQRRLFLLPICLSQPSLQLLFLSKLIQQLFTQPLIFLLQLTFISIQPRFFIFLSQQQVQLPVQPQPFSSLTPPIQAFLIQPCDLLLIVLAFSFLIPIVPSFLFSFELLAK